MPLTLAPERTTDFPSILAASIGIGAFGMALGLTYPLLTLLLAERGVAPHIIGLNAAAMGIGIAISTLFMSHFTMRFRAESLIVAGLLGTAVVILAFLSTDSIIVWFALRIVLGFCANAVFVLTEAWVNVAASDHIRGRAVSGYTMSLSAGFAIGPLGIPLFGMDTALPFAACATLVSLTAIGIAILSRRTKVRTEEAPKGSLWRFALTAPLLVAMVMTFGFSDWTIISVMPLYFLEKGMSGALASTTVSVVHFGMILCALPTGIALDRWSRMGTAIVCAAGAAICFTLLAVLDADRWVLWIVLLVLGGSSVGLYTTALTLLGERFNGGMLVAGSAVFSMAFTIAGTIGMLGTGALMSLVGHEAVPLLFVTFFFILLLAMLRPTNLKN